MKKTRPPAFCDYDDNKADFFGGPSEFWESYYKNFKIQLEKTRGKPLPLSAHVGDCHLNKDGDLVVWSGKNWYNPLTERNEND